MPDSSNHISSNEAGTTRRPALVLRRTLLPPAQAAALLAVAHPSAAVNKDSVSAYAQAMRDGRWIANGQPIVLSRAGRVLDGVQRLAACVETGIPLDALIVDDVDDEAFHSIDQHRRRSPSGILRPRGVVHHHLLANLIMRLLRYDEGSLASPQGTGTSWSQLEHILGMTAAHREALSLSLSMPQSPLPEPVRTMILYMGNQVNPPLTARLLAAVLHPEDWPPDEPGSLLRQEIDRSAEIGGGPQRTPWLIALSIKALNAMLRGEKPRRLSWAARPVGDRPAEPFPHLEGYAGLPPLPAAAPHGVVAGLSQEDGLAGQIETIDATLARRYLTMSIASRHPIKSHVEALARDIKRGQWFANGQPICFSRSGRLINGQHRLLAVIEAQGWIRVPVIRGLPEEALPTYDTQPRRVIRAIMPAKAADGSSSFGDQALAIAMASLLWRYERKTFAITSKRAALTEIHEILASNPRLLELRGFARKMVEYGRSSVMGYGAYVIERDNPALAAPFLAALSTGADLSAGHPILALRRNLQKLRRDKASQAEQLNALLAGWRLFKVYVAAKPGRA